jgi:uncharacterized protein
MGEQTPGIGTIGWMDLTVEDAEAVRDFYRAVVGWEAEPVTMDGYADFNMTSEGEVVAGICHARGGNRDLPAQWLIYITVENVEAAAKRCAEKGGTVVVEPRPLGGGFFCVVQDPAGAVAALYQQGAAS